MNVRVDVLCWMDECLLNKRPTMMSLAEEKKQQREFLYTAALSPKTAMYCLFLSFKGGNYE